MHKGGWTIDQLVLTSAAIMAFQICYSFPVCIYTSTFVQERLEYTILSEQDVLHVLPGVHNLSCCRFILAYTVDTLQPGVKDNN